jgi:hypothetical protein
LTLKSACWDRDFAIAWFRTSTVVDSEGVHGWWAISYHRKTRSWACDPAQQERRIEVSIEANGQAVVVAGSFPEGISARRAKAMIADTGTLAMQPTMPLAACSPSTDDAIRWARSRLDPPAADMDAPAAEVAIANDGAVVDHGWSLRFRFDPDDRPVCWGELIVVD